MNNILEFKLSKKNKSSEIYSDNIIYLPFQKVDDPLLDLLNEYASMAEFDLPKHLKEDLELEDESSSHTEMPSDEVFHSLEVFMNRNKKKKGHLELIIK